MTDPNTPDDAVAALAPLIAEYYPPELFTSSDLFEIDSMERLLLAQGAILREQRGDGTQLDQELEAPDDDKQGNYVVPLRRETISSPEEIETNEPFSLWDIIIENEANVLVEWADDPGADKDRYIGNNASPTKIGGIPVETSYVRVQAAADSNNDPVLTIKGWP
jgi:hypothetical protein